MPGGEGAGEAGRVRTGDVLEVEGEQAGVVGSRYGSSVSLCDPLGIVGRSGGWVEQ